MEQHDLIILGGGPAGMAAAYGAYQEGIRDILILERDDTLGGILNQCIHNGFGLHRFQEELTGPEYAARYENFLASTSVAIRSRTMAIDLTADHVITAVSEEKGIQLLKGKAIILAMGCRERPRGAIATPGDRVAGIYTAGAAQKYCNIDGYLVGKRIVILGSGDIGLIMARRMTLEGAKVLGVSELMPYSNGLNRNIVQCLKDFDIPLRLHNTVTKIIGKPNLTAIEISDVDDNLRPIKGTEQIIECDTLLLSVGLYPINTIFTEGAHGKLYAKTKGAFVDQNLETSIPGVFSAGNVLHVHDLVDFVSMEGEIAGKNAANLILNGRKDVKKVVEVTESNNVGYVLPNIINVTDATDSVEFSFRVRKPMKRGEIIIRDGDTVVKSIKAMDLLPSEMKKVTLKTNDFESYNHLFVEVKEL